MYPVAKNKGQYFRKLNKRLNQLEKYYRQEVLKSAPVTVQITTGSKCNLECIFCTDRDKQAYLNYQNLSLESFQSFLLDPLYLASEVQLYGWGEPFVNPSYERIFDFVANNFPGIVIHLSTNGTLLSRKWAQKLVAYDNCSVNVSIDAATRKTYASLKKRDVFDQVIENVKKLSHVRRKSGKNNPFIMLSFVALTKNIEELPQFVELAAELDVDYILIQDLAILSKPHEELSLINDPEKAHQFFILASEKAKEKGIAMSSFLSYSVDYFLDDGSRTEDRFSGDYHISRWDSRAYSIPVESSYPATDCFEPWEKLMVGEDGSVHICCRSRTPMGNLFTQKLQEIWNGEMYRYYRRTINTSDPPYECAICPRKKGCD